MKSRFAVPVLLCLMLFVQGLWFIGTQSLTFDEPVHILDGLGIWKSGRVAAFEHPPLARAFFTLPLLWRDWPIDFNRGRTGWNDHAPRAWLTWVPADPQGLAWHTRPMNLLLGVALGALLWITAQRLYSVGAANVTLLLFVFSPAVIAHFSLATTDGIGVLMIFAAAAQFVVWRRNPSRLQTAILGVVLGVLLAAKMYTVPLFLLALGLAVILRPERPWRKAATMAAIACLVVWATYLFHVSHLRLADGQLFIQSQGSPDYHLAALHTARSIAIPLPAGEYVTGLIDMFRHSRWGHPSFFLGNISQNGGWEAYYPMVILLKWPTAVLLLALSVLYFSLKRRVPLPRDLAIMLLFPAVFLALSIFSKIDIGDRHILPVYPFLLLVCGGIWQFHQGRKVALLAVILFLGLHVADVMRYAPDYLSYFNVFVDPSNSYQLLSDSNLDWGQGLIALRDYQAGHPNEPLHMVYFGSTYPSQYGVHAEPLREDERVTGTVVVSATHLSGQLLRHPGSYQWLLQYPRTAILDHTLHVFQVPTGATRHN